MAVRLDQYLYAQKLASSRSQAENYIKLGYVKLNGIVSLKPGKLVPANSVVVITADKMYVSRAALKLVSVVDELKIDFKSKVVLDIGSSTGGFSQLALSRGAAKIIAVEAGTNQMNARLRVNPKIELHEQTDIRDIRSLSTKVDIVLIDVSFISLRQVLPGLLKLIPPNCQLLAMVKPQFEMAGQNRQHKGVIKNESIRRMIFKEFENWVKSSFKMVAKADSKVAGEKGNKERFYLLKPLAAKDI